MLSKQIRNSFLLFLAAVIWGVSFVAQDVGMNCIGPFTFAFVRNIIAAAVLVPFTLLSKEKSQSGRQMIVSAVLSGIALGSANCLQMCGILYTTVGKAGFLTALYIIFVPIMGLFTKKKCSLFVWIAVGLALTGIYFLCITGDFSINKGDILEILCAVAFAVQIMIISKHSSAVNVYKFACIQFFTAGLVAAVPMMLTESITWSDIAAAWIPLLYAGVLSGGAAYTLQIIGQRDLNPTLAAIIMSFESCVAAIAGWIILDQTLSVREITGCIIMFAAIIIAQIRK